VRPCPLHSSTNGSTGAAHVAACVCQLGRVQLEGGGCGCPEETYYSVESTSCVSCPPTKSSAAGSESCDVCAPGYYRISAGSQECDLCPEGSHCPLNTTITTLQVLPGYWRLSVYAPRMYKCKGGNVSTITCIGGPPESCAPGHSGPQCQVCTESDYYFDDGVCRECPDAGGTLAALLSVTLPLLGVLAFLLWLHHQPHSERFGAHSKKLRRITHHFLQFFGSIGVIAKFKLTLSFMQVIAALDRTYQVGLPDSWFQWTKVFRFFGEINWTDWVVPTACIFGEGMHHVLFLRALGPLLAIIALPLAFGIASFLFAPRKPPTEAKAGSFVSSRRKRTVKGHFANGLYSGLPISLVASFCFTPSVSAFIFQAWHCEPFVYDATEDHDFLGRDLSVRCGDFDEHRRIVTTAWVFVVLWPIGMVITYFALLFPVRKLLLDGESVSPLLYATTFLHRDYKASYFWWEIFSLVQRTVLTGWLLLIDTSLPFLRLLSALVISIFFLTALLVCVPYERILDFGLAVCAQLLLVCIFIGGILVRLYKDIANDPSGSVALAHRFLGLNSSEEAVVIMIIVSFIMLISFVCTLFAQTYFHARQLRLEAKWSVCTLEPPTVRWELDGIYAAFLSHYKMEAASEARYLHDTLRKICQTPVFLDSSSLKDLRHLISEGLCNSDVFVLMLTEGVLTRPWCLLEVYEAKTRAIPIVLLDIQGGRFEMSNAKAYISHLETRMSQENPAGLDLIKQELDDIPLSQLQQRVMDVLNEFTPAQQGGGGSPVLRWNSSAGDQTILASFKDLVERMGELTSREVKWRPAKNSRTLPWEVQQEGKRKTSSRFSSSTSQPPAALIDPSPASRGQRLSRRSAGDINLLDIAAYIIFDKVHSADASVLGAEISRRLDRTVRLGGDKDALDAVLLSRAVVLVLSKDLLVTPSCIAELYAALKSGLPIISVLLDHGGYDFEETRRRLGGDLEKWFEGRTEDQLEKPLRELLDDNVDLAVDDNVDLADVQKTIYSNITSIIAIAWQPHGSQNLFVAAINDVCHMVPAPVPLRQLKRSNSFGVEATSIKEVVVLAQKLKTSTDTPTVDVSTVAQKFKALQVSITSAV